MMRIARMSRGWVKEGNGVARHITARLSYMIGSPGFHANARGN